MRRALGVALLPLSIAPLVALGPPAVRAERRTYEARFSERPALSVPALRLGADRRSR